MSDNQATAGNNVPGTSTPSAPSAPAPSGAPAGQFTQEQVNALLEAARRQEKDKLYQRLQDAEQKVVAANAAIAEKDGAIEVLQSKQSELATQLSTLRDENLSTDQKVLAELERYRTDLNNAVAQTQALQQEIKAVRAAATDEIAASELRLYQQKAVAAAGVTLTELVGGKTRAEVDASIKAAQEREALIAERVAEQLRAQNAAALPNPINPSSASETSRSRSMRPEDRRKLAKLSPKEYQQQRALMLEEARKAAGQV